MSAETYLAVRCDHRDDTGERCDTEWGHPVRVDTHRELRRHLKTRGWRIGRRRDLCPDHAAA